MKRIAVATLTLLVAGGFGAALGAQTPPPGGSILPGYWEYKTRISILTVDTKKQCVTPANVDQFFSGPCNRHHTCVYPVREVANGKARFEGYWQNKEGARAKVTASGEYTPTSFTLRASGTTTDGLPMAATLEARRISETCPPGSQ